ncbi:hypothetical protein [Bradyrhizobium sp.]|uniref:hypothetical protein n=1 Tax=Bradyrhizobium sp. TaxID=376 RepID=UPI002D4D9E5B|nr:hypothetical protein [Bradyrhizobium sp.]HZR76821.1 hypothetical protein [Bradyrhizobium sp.]
MVLHDYFKGVHRASIASPDGAHLTGDIVTALAGEVQYAQADNSTDAHKVIGHVTKLVGSATATRNGVSIILNNGDNVEKGDVVASGSDSTLGITFIDGTVFGLSSNARMVLNEMVYDPNGSSNSSLLSLVAGTITFVAGETAKHGDMKVDTPVATMGIRGTAVLVEIDFSVPGAAPDAKFQVLVEPDGTTGSYILFDKQTLTPLAVVDQAGMQINISNGVMSQTLAPLSPELQKLITDVFALKFSDSSNTKSIEHFTDSIVPTNAFGPFKLDVGLLAPVSVTITSQGTGSNGAPGGSPDIIPHVPNGLTIQTTNGIIIQRAGAAATGQDTVSGTITFADINATDRPTVSTHFISFTLTNALGKDISGTVTAAELAEINAALALAVNSSTGNNGVDSWTYSIPASALSFLPAGATLTLNYNATVDNNYAPHDETLTAPITITIKSAAEIWSETKEIASPSPGDWATGANWLTGAAPTASDDVIIVTDPTKSGTPFYPVTIGEGDPAAFADSVTMDDLGSLAPELDNFNKLTIGSGGLHLNADSILKNFGTISVGGIAEILQHSVLQNSGPLAHLTLQQGGDFKDESQITNSGTIEVAGSTLNVEVDIANKGGTLQIDDFAKLTLSDGATIDHGAITLGASSVLDIETAAGATLDGVAVTATSGFLQSGIAIGALTPGGSTLTMKDGASISGGEMTIAGGSTLDVESGGGATLDGVTVVGTSGVSASLIEIGVTTEGGSTLTLLDGTSIASGNMTIAASSVLDIEAGTLGPGATLDGVAVTGSSDPSTIAIGLSGPATLLLDDGTTITNGNMTIAANSTLDVEAGTTGPGATLDGVTVTGVSPNGVRGETSDKPSKIEVGTSGAATTLLVDDGTTIINGELKIAGGSTLDAEAGTTGPGATLDGVTVTGTDANAALSVTASTIEVGLSGAATLVLDDGTSIKNGNLTNAGTLDIEAGTHGPGATLDGVTVTEIKAIKGESSDASIGEIEVGTLGAASLLLDDGTTITKGNLTIGGGSMLDVESALGATLDHATVAGTNADASLSVAASTIAIGLSGPATLTLEGGTSVANGNLTIGGGSTLDVESAPGSTLDGVIATGISGDLASTIEIGVHTIGGSILTLLDGTSISYGDMTIAVGSTLDIESSSGAALDGVNVANSGTIQVDTGPETTTVTLVLDGGTAITGGDLLIHHPGSGENGVVEIKTGGATFDDLTVTNNGELIIDASVTLTLTDNTSILGGTIDDAGTLLVSSSSEITNATIDGGGNVTVTGGALTFSGVTLDDVKLSGSITNADTLTIDETVTLNGASISGGTIDDTGAIVGHGAIGSVITGSGTVESSGGTLTLSGVNTYTGETTIDSGSTLALSSTGSIADSSDVVDNGTFDITATSGASIVTLSGNGTVDLGSKTLTLTNGSTTFSGAINGTGGLTVDGTSTTETLGGTNIYSGVTTIGSGETLALSSTGSIADSSDVIDNGTFDISATPGASIVTLSGNGAVDLGNRTLTLTKGSTTFGGIINGTGGLTVDGTGTTETLGGTNTYSGVTTIGSGETLALSSTGSIADSSDVVDNGTFDITATSGASIVTLSGNGTVDLGSKTLTLTNGSTTFSGAIDGTGGLTVDGAGTTETLGGTNTYSGVTTIGSGETLALSSTGSIADSSDVVDNGTFDISATDASIVTLSGNGTVKLGAHTLTLTNGSTSFSGAITGTGGLTVDGTGTETLGGANTYSGVTTIGSGETLALSSTGSISDSSDVIDNGTFDISATSGASIVTLSGNGTVDLGAATLTLTKASTSFSGTIGGTGTGGGLTVASGTQAFGTVTLDDLTLSGSFSETGTVTIDDTVTLNGATLSGGTIDVAGILDSEGTSSISGATINNPGHINVVSGKLTIDPAPFTNKGTIEVDGKADLVLSGETVTNSVTVGLTTTNGTIQVDSQGLLTLSGSSINGGIVDNLGTIDVTSASSINNTFSFVNTGTVKADGAALTLSGTTVTNAGGTLESAGSGLVDLVNAIVNNGNLSGKFSTATGNSSSTLNGLTLELGTLVTATVGVLELTGIITNNGEIDANGGAVHLVSSTLDSGTLGGSGTITTVGSGLDTFNGVTISHGTTVTVADHTALDLSGTITDAGTIALSSSGHTTQLEISGSVSLSGGGAVTMSDVADTTGHVDNFIVSDGSAATLTNSDTIAGAGTIGDSNLTLINSGTIDATGTHALVIATGVTNNSGGILEASAGSELDIDGNVVNNGTIEANGVSSFVKITGNVTNTTGSTGAIDISAGGHVEITGSVSAGETVTFEQSNGAGLLTLDDSHGFQGTIAGLVEAPTESQENHVDLLDLAWTGRMHVSFASGHVTVTNGSGDHVSLAVSGTSGDFEITEDSSGHTLLDDPATTGTVTVDSNQVLGVSAATSATIDFTNSSGNTGELLLNDSHDFTGTIVGFAGDGTIANSDLIDVTDVDFANVATDKTTYTENAAGTGGTLTLHDANGQVLDSINFTGSYQLANFTVESDGSGGTLIVDPPVDSSTAANTIVASGADQTLSGSGASDNFVFNFAGVGHSTIANFDPVADTIQVSSSMFANVQAILNAAHDDGHGNSVIAIDAHDSIILNGVSKTQLHASDFHVV